MLGTAAAWLWLRELWLRGRRLPGCGCVAVAAWLWLCGLWLRGNVPSWERVRERRVRVKRRVRARGCAPLATVARASAPGVRAKAMASSPAL